MLHSLLHVVRTEMCVGSVHNHPIMIKKIHPVFFFFLSTKIFFPFSNEPISL